MRPKKVTGVTGVTELTYEEDRDTDYEQFPFEE